VFKLKAAYRISAACFEWPYPDHQPRARLPTAWVIKCLTLEVKEHPAAFVRVSQHHATL